MDVFKQTFDVLTEDNNIKLKMIRDLESALLAVRNSIKNTKPEDIIKFIDETLKRIE